MLRSLAFACIATVVTLPALAADLSGMPPAGYGKAPPPMAPAGRGRFLAVESPPFDKIITYAPPRAGADPVQVHSYFGPPQVSHYYSHYGMPDELRRGRPNFGCNYYGYC